MPKTDPAVIRELKSKIQQLTKAVLNQAENDPSFASELLGIATGEHAPSPGNRTRRRDKFDPVTFLLKNNRDTSKLRQHLGEAGVEFVTKLVRQLKLASPKEIKEFEEQKLIDLVVAHGEEGVERDRAFLTARAKQTSAQHDEGKVNHSESSGTEESSDSDHGSQPEEHSLDEGKTKTSSVSVPGSQNKRDGESPHHTPGPEMDNETIDGQDTGTPPVARPSEGQGTQSEEATRKADDNKSKAE